jgi:hypothetical protein
VVASELGFLALGGLLGTLAGAALIAVLRARPPAARQIRLTVTSGSVRIRPWATTLAGDPFALEPGPLDWGGPADVDPRGPEVFATDPGRRQRNGTPVLSAAPSDATPGTDRTASTRAAPGSEPAPERIGLSIGSGLDPVLEAIITARTSDRSGTAGTGIGVLEAAVRSRRVPPAHGYDAGGIAVLTRPEPGPAEIGAATEARIRGGSGGDFGGGGRDDAYRYGRAQAAATGTDQCAEARHAVDERCALAERMRLTAERAVDALREAQRTFDVHMAHAEAADAVAEPRAQRAAKDEAQNAFRTERARAGSRESVEQAARDWLLEINRINAAAHEAAATLVREREAAAALLPTIERLTVDADAARVQAEGAGESCVLARESLAACEERVRRAALAATGGPGSGRPDDPEGIPEGTASPVTVAATPAGSAPSSVAPEPAPVEEEGALIAAMRSGGHPALLGLLAGDRAVMQRLVRELAGDDAVDQRRWQIQLADLVDAIVSRAIEACAFVFPDDHPFWGPFNRDQGRDIALALSSLGFRFDGLGGFADDRVPTQRDLSLALGYAGLDPMRVRRWPEGGEFEELYREVTVAADEYILGAAPDLTLGELVGNLGRRANALTEVWNAWGHIRPILLEETG